MSGSVQDRLSAEAVSKRVADEKVIENGARRSYLGWVVDKSLPGDVGGRHLKLQIRLGVLGAQVDERLHDFVLVQAIVGAHVGIIEEVFLLVGREVDV